MAFRFPLQALRRVRSIYERRERQRLEILVQRLAQAEKELAALRKVRLEQAGALAKSLKEGMSGAELQFQVVCSTLCQRRISVAVQRADDVSQQHQRQLTVYRQARQKTEVMERLYQRYLSSYRRTQTRREQQQATDLFVICSQTANDGY
jgi:flagellar export protein FliJ